MRVFVGKRGTLLAAVGAAVALPLACAGPAAAHPRRHHHHHHRHGRQLLANLADVPCSDTAVQVSATNLAGVRQAVLCLINRERARAGLEPLQPNGRLTAAAQRYAQRMVAEGFFSDTSPSGETLLARAAAAGWRPPAGDGYYLGENIAWGTGGDSTAEAIVAAWMASPPHRANILNPRYRQTGVGVVPGVAADRGEGQPGATYAQEFAAIIR